MYSCENFIFSNMRLISASLQSIFLRTYAFQASQSLPVIKVPGYVTKHIEKVKKKDAIKLLNLKKKISYRGNTNYPVITSTDKEYNFYLGQRYNSNYPIPLQSKYWFKTKSSGQKFTIHPWDSNPSLPVHQNEKHENEAYFPKTFQELITDKCLLQEIQRCGYESPTPVQVLAIPHILERQHVLMSSETGSGKTLAYLAPIIQNISSVKQSVKLFPNTPLALVVTPGQELAEQIGNFAYSLGRSSGVNVGVLVRDGAWHRHLRLVENSDVDVLVATIGTLLKLVSRGVFKLANLIHLVLDEADTLLDESFIEETHLLLRRIPCILDVTEEIKPPFGTRLVFSSSVYPSGGDTFFPELFENGQEIFKIKSPYLHRVLPHVTQKFLRVSNDSRTGELLALVKSDFEKNIPVMIFCNKSPACDWVSTFLEDNDIPNVKFHAALTPSQRARALHLFKSGIESVMCCTDLASRGLDTQHVRHVINFDFPHNVSDYILRSGRVGRVGSNHGYVTSLIVSVPGVYTVQEIEHAVRSSARIADVDSDIKKKIRKLYYSP